MKIPSLLACLLIATTASAADLNRPDAVVQARNQNVQLLPRLPAPDLSLRGQVIQESARQMTFVSTSPRNARLTQAASAKFRSFLPTPPLYDAPSYRIPAVLPDNLPPGTPVPGFDRHVLTRRIR